MLRYSRSKISKDVGTMFNYILVLIGKSSLGSKDSSERPNVIENAYSFEFSRQNSCVKFEKNL